MILFASSYYSAFSDFHGYVFICVVTQQTSLYVAGASDGGKSRPSCCLPSGEGAQITRKEIE